LADIDFCLRYGHRLTDWEARFVASVHGQRYPLTARQRNALNRIVDKLRARAEAA
jgi:hypothetical protein